MGERRQGNILYRDDKYMSDTYIVFILMSANISDQRQQLSMSVALVVGSSVLAFWSRNRCISSSQARAESSP